MKIYMHCLTNQDITKQFAYTNEIREIFFDNAKDQEEISIIGIKSGIEQKVRVLTATDCRFNANFKYVLSSEGYASIGDIVIFYKIGFRQYRLEVIEKSNPKYEAYKVLFSDPRHLPIFTNYGQVDLKDLNENSSSPKATNSAVQYAQIIYYGVPGCGKSYSIENELRKLGITKTMEADCTKRVVFHPEYTNADFIGQILPQSMDSGEKISYSFVAGPFTQILAKAYTHKNTPYALIIEEINRGNAAAIFGELFQLLDRLDKDETGMSNGVLYEKNWSCYPVTNDNINKEIFAAYDKYKNDKDTCIFEPFIAEENFKKYKLNIGIRLPPNLSILATMNTSDQNVFILDNAFQRRWDMVLVKNEFGDDSKNQRDARIAGSKITWEKFQEVINKKISQFSKENNFSSMIDKRLGCWFVKAVPDKNDANGKYIITEDSFKNKILKYLWDDAFKFCHEDVFEDADNFEALLEKVKMDNPNFGVFKNVDFSEKEEEN